MSTGIEIRPATDDDTPAVLGLLRESLGWDQGPRYEALFAWKHRRSPFGPSPAWIALEGARVVGFRALLRWEFELGGNVVRAVRPVDTATHPDYQGRGIFSRLTVHALEAIRQDGVDLVFNTPNSQSLPGYLKMGWEPLGRLQALARPTRVWRIARMVTARTPASRWSLETTVGLPAAEVLDDEDSVKQLIRSPGPPRALRTRRSAAYLRWRYGDPLLGYRVALGAGDAAGAAIFRIRRRGKAREAALCEVLTPAQDGTGAAQLIRRLTQSVDADYVLGISTPELWGSGLHKVPGKGPALVARTLSDAPPPDMSSWVLTLGDIELF